MTENTKIEWADATFNPWVGCQKISVGPQGACVNCYAESWAKRAGNPELWNGSRRRTTPANWKQPIKWNREAHAAGVRKRVFCASLADVFDNDVPEAWRADLWALIEETPHLTWMLLTKRIGNAKSMLPWYWQDPVTPQRNVWLGATIATQEEADRDIAKLLTVPARVHFISAEPLLGQINLTQVTHKRTLDDGRTLDIVINALQHGKIFSDHSPLDWVIVGGESSHNARPMNPAWVRELRRQCNEAGIAYFFKQWGNWLPACQDEARLYASAEHDSAEHDWDGSDTGYSIHVRTKGHRILDGRIWSEFPT